MAIELTPAQTSFLKSHISEFDPAWRCESAGQAGSDRRFIRVWRDDKSLILVIWNSEDKDWMRFKSIASEIGRALPFLPRLYAVDDTHGLILEEDLGRQTLHTYATAHAADKALITQAYRRVIDALAQWQDLDRSVSPSMQARSMDLEMFLWESEYFTRHCVVEYFGLERLTGTEWEKERATIAARAVGYPQVFIHRDFQSENVMMTTAGVRFVDFQGGRLGPAGYDLASLLCDPYADYLDPGLIGTLFSYYTSLTPCRCDRDQFLVCAVQRLMQALGAYGNLSLHKGKDRYRFFVKPALERLSRILAEYGGLPVLSGIVAACATPGMQV